MRKCVCVRTCLFLVWVYLHTSKLENLQLHICIMGLVIKIWKCSGIFEWVNLVVTYLHLHFRWFHKEIPIHLPGLTEVSASDLTWSQNCPDIWLNPNWSFQKSQIHDLFTAILSLNITTVSSLNSTEDNYTPSRPFKQMILVWYMVNQKNNLIKPIDTPRTTAMQLQQNQLY